MFIFYFHNMLLIKHYVKYSFGFWAVIHKETNEFLEQCGLTIQNLS
jgi:hypothetical protein